ncbi:MULTISPECIES: hypothetical protein [Spirulina sp. CCY15215]|nr:hypothetical protein [Spirulina major]
MDFDCFVMVWRSPSRSGDRCLLIILPHAIACYFLPIGTLSFVIQ